MNSIKPIYPSLTQDDILTLLGQPVAKRNESARKAIEEWIYYDIKEKNTESYIFRNGKLVNYNKKMI